MTKVSDHGVIVGQGEGERERERWGNKGRIGPCDACRLSTAVYTRNRNFRLYRSSKLGKTTKLRVAKENKFRSSYPEGTSNRKRWNDRFNTLMDSLVCNVRYT